LGADDGDGNTVEGECNVEGWGSKALPIVFEEET